MTGSSSKLPLMKHQKYAVACMEHMDQMAIFYEAGTGKTAIALTWAIRAIRRGEVRSILVVCPASLVGNWRASIRKMAQFEDVEKEDVEALEEAVTITSYRKLWRNEVSVMMKSDGSTEKKSVRVLAPFADRFWDAAIIDESHAIGGHSSGQTKACLLLAQLAKHRYIMSGTPVSGSTKGSGKDWKKLYGQISFLNPHQWRNWTDFCRQLVLETDNWHNPKSYREAECEAIIQKYGIFAKLESCVDMPGYTDTFIPCELIEKKVYEDFKNKVVRQYNLDPQTGGGMAIKLLQVVSGHYKDSDKAVHQLKTSKDAALEDILTGTEDRVVIFCNFRASVDRCADIAKKLGRKTVIFDGRCHGKATWEEFQYGDAEVVVIQYQAGGEGIDLIVSHTMVLYEPCRTSLKMSQARARVYRKGQSVFTRYLILCTEGTSEAKVWDSVLNGVDVTDKMLMEYSI